MIKFNGKDVTPKINGVNLSRVMYNGKKIWPLDPAYYIPEEAPNGVYVYANDGLLYIPDKWDTSRNDAVGVAVVTDNTRLCITKGDKPQRAWSNQLYHTDVPGVTNFISIALTRIDYNGQINTTTIIAAATSESASNNAAHYCYSQTVSVNGSIIHGYLPAIGELEDAYNNKSAVDSAMSMIGGSAIPTTDQYIWSSTEFGGNPELCAWSLDWVKGWTYSGAHKDYSSHCAIPCFPILPTLIDLGLPSGTLWSATNLGAFKPEQAGYYYQWGDTIGWTKDQIGTDKTFNWANYKWSVDGSSSNFSKYNSTDGKTVLDLEDDAVYATLGSNWKMPTHEDWQELYNNTEQQWTQVNGVNGYKCTASNGNYIFLPAAGDGYGSSLYFEGSSGFVWSSSLNSVGSPDAFSCNFLSGGFNPGDGYDRFYGFPVRGVYKP